MKNKTIVAISTPIGTGGVAIVRLSGKKALEITSKTIDKNISKKARYMFLVKIKTKNFTERALAVYFKNPNSYTGEDLVEIQCHGGVIIAKGIMDELIDNGATLAEAGEFTKRAFLNGKISLEGAEGIIDMINANSQAEVRAGYNLLNGELYKQVNAMQKKLTDIMASIEVAIDYPEHDIEETTINGYINNLNFVISNVEKLLKTTKTGKIIKSGINTAILGRPNVGKSSLMNALLNYDRAIVTDVAGTTRDTLEESYNYKGIKINLIDTAGIRVTEEKVEKIGIERAKKALYYADIVLIVLDGTEKLTQQDKINLELVKNKKHIIVQNKIDKQNKKIKIANSVHMISAVTKEGVNELKEKIYDMVIDNKIINSNVLITNKRHEVALNNALNCVLNAKQSLQKANTLDLVAIDIGEAWDYLGQITGQTNKEEIIDVIFKKFCLGK